MTLQHILKKFIKLILFDCIGAIFTCVHGASLTFGPFWVRKLKKKMREPSRAWIESIYGAGLNVSKSWIKGMTEILAVDQ